MATFEQILFPMKISDISLALNDFAPSAYQESYDNTGLLIGDSEAELTGILCSHDLSYEIIDEAVKKNCNLIVCHHPPIFQGIKSVLKDSDESGIVYHAVRNGLSVYSTHTALDNRLYGGNQYTARILGLENLKILSPQSNQLCKLYSYCPESHIENVKEAVFSAGAGHIGNYSECSFEVLGKGSFKAEEGADPFVGKKGIRHEEMELKFEILFEKKDRSKVLKALLNAHPYEEVAYEIIEIANQNQEIGSGLIGDLDEAMDQEKFLKMVKESFAVDILKHNGTKRNEIRKVAICGGSGSFLLPSAIASGADAFITGDVGYHRFFDSKDKICLIDVGHFESEQFVMRVLYDFLNEKFANFAVHLADTITNPVKYF
jgi:dinuclear metal center YbgI/SA1388 family protein